MSSFVAQDFALLTRHFDVTPFRWRRAVDVLPLTRAMARHDVSFTWFLGHHAAAAALAAAVTGKASVAVHGGTEMTSPHVTGGPPPTARDRWAARIAADRTRLVLALSDFTLREGLAVRRSGSGNALRVLYPGIDTTRFSPRGDKQRLVLTVGYVSRATVHRKRMDVFVDAARLVPDARFMLAGERQDGAAEALGRRAGDDVELVFDPEDDALTALYRRARVYVQASRHEAFGLSLAEAMACGCVPVVTRAAALPEVVGDTGVIVDEPCDAEGVARGIRDALASDTGARARRRVIERFGIERREAGLVRAIEDAITKRLPAGVDPAGTPAR
jgi:glycosyltransferase involved in cell wall biosynthesis